MKGIRISAMAGCFVVASLAIFAWAQQTREPSKLREEANQLINQGNFRDALTHLKELLSNPSVPGDEAARDLKSAAECIARLNLYGDLDDLLEQTLAVHGNDWQVVSQAASELLRAPHHGVILDQQFRRGPWSGRTTGRMLETVDQDRQRALRLAVRALVLAGAMPADVLPELDSPEARNAPPAPQRPAAEASDQQRAELWLRLVDVLLEGRGDRWAWRLLAKTPLDRAPDYLDFEASTNFPARYASVDEEGQPIFWQVPKSWNASASDAERLRWALEQNDATKENAPRNQAKLRWADLLHSQFSVDTLQEQLWILRSQRSRAAAADADDSSSDREQTDEADASDPDASDPDELPDAQSGILAVHTLKEEETIAKLASGVRRFTLPDDLNPIRIYQQVAQSKGPHAEEAQLRLVSTFENRRQYTKAAELLEQAIARFGDSDNAKQSRLDNIVKPRGQIEGVASQPAGQGAKFHLLFRNAHAVAFTARRVDLEMLISDTKAFYKNHDQTKPAAFAGGQTRWPPSLDYPNPLFSEKELPKYAGPPVANWSMELEPRENHWDRRITVTSPLDKAGLYVVDASLDDGQHATRCLVWVNDLAIVRKAAAGNALVYVADAVTGAPVSGANVEFFTVQNVPNRPRFTTQNFARKTDAVGQILLPQSKPENQQWMIVARDNRGRLAVSGLQHVWASGAQRQDFSMVKAYGVADQPVHRPGDSIKAKFWVGRASYGSGADTAPLADHMFSIRMLDPQGKIAWEGTQQSDAFGGFEIDVPLAKAAALGIYSFDIRSEKQRIFSNLRVRVEEFRKPEFEVTIDSPNRPVQLGEKIEATVKAKYYFGSPVTEAFVNVRVTRKAYVDNWYPARPFDWCYEPGYWWFGYDYTWYPGWSRWAGCGMPRGPWMPRFGFEPPELVLEQELTLDDEGSAKLTIDTAVAAQIFGDQDHQYNIEVEVRDASRRTITASGSVIASRQPFKIYSWLGRGYYEVNQTVEAHFVAQTLDRQPVAAAGKLELLRITYDAQRRPQETVVEAWDAQTDSQGNFDQRLVARRGGQYRLRLRLKDEAGHEVEGAYIFTIRGDDQAADNFRFSQLELIPDKSEYAPGERVELQINADRADATVLLFVRASGGVVPTPKVVRLSAKTAKVEIPVTATDQPNFFVEALTIYNGRFYSANREIIVPPANRVLDVAVAADKSEYLPGEQGTLDVSVKDADGQPVSGSVLVSIYDRSLEAIASDVLPDDIREFFWKWRRSHNPTNWENLSRVTQQITIDQTVSMTPIGLFGSSLADDAEQVFSLGGMRGMRADGAQYGMAGGMAGGIADLAEMRQAMPRGGDLPGAAPTAAFAQKSAAGQPAETAPTAVRKQFADSALWLTRLETDSRGRAKVPFTMPENLSDWQMRSWAIGPELRVGSGKSTAVTRKHILVRLATPRFLVERDQVVLSAIVHNDFDSAADVRVRLEIDGQTQLEFESGTEAERSVHIAAGQQARVDWKCRALAEGEVTLRAFAESARESDAMQLKLPIIVNGVLKTDSWAGTVRAEQASSSIQVKIPAERRPEHSRLTVRLSPSLALSMVDALPYLAGYPYGCTEQTLNRFLPTVITQQVLTEMKIDLRQVQQHRNNLNAQELGDAQKRGKNRLPHNPVFDQAEVARMVEAGVQKLADMQNGDGGWGWFSGPYDHSSPHMTATVVRGLWLAQENGAAIVPDVLQRGLAWLEQHQNTQLEMLNNAEGKTQPYKERPDNVDALVFHTLVTAGKRNDAMQTLLYEKRDGLNIYGKALLAWATHVLGDREQTAMLRRNIEQFLVEDAENETAYLRDQSPWWMWYGSQIEATAIYLKLLAVDEPNGRIAPRIVKYLLNNRRNATYWNSTRDTALVIEAFADYLRASGETAAEVKGEVWLGGKRLGTVEFTPATLFTAETTVEIAGNAVPSGEHTLEIRRTGRGPLYYSVYSTNFTLEEDIAAAGLEVKIQRRYYRLDPTARQLDQAGSRGELVQGQRAAHNRVRIDDLQDLPSGTLVEVELIVESKNDYEYLMIEERKAAGLEPVDIQSGYDFSGGLSTYREMREKHVAFFLRNLPRGQHSLHYRLRAEAPGVFTALPAVISGMYAPELAGNSSDQDIRVSEE